jgi:hypothetical protein
MNGGSSAIDSRLVTDDQDEDDDEDDDEEEAEDDKWTPVSNDRGGACSVVCGGVLYSGAVMIVVCTRSI